MGTTPGWQIYTDAPWYVDSGYSYFWVRGNAHLAHVELKSVLELAKNTYRVVWEEERPQIQELIRHAWQEWSTGFIPIAWGLAAHLDQPKSVNRPEDDEWCLRLYGRDLSLSTQGLIAAGDATPEALWSLLLHAFRAPVRDSPAVSMRSSLPAQSDEQIQERIREIHRLWRESLAIT